EGLFDYAVLWQAGFCNVSCAMGNHLNAHQVWQFCDGPRNLYLNLNWHTNGNGHAAAQEQGRPHKEQSIKATRGVVPPGSGAKQLLRPERRCTPIPVAAGGCSPMKFRVVHQPPSNHARSPFRIVEQASSREVDWINRFLDRECLRRVADATLRSYAHDLL